MSTEESEQIQATLSAIVASPEFVRSSRMVRFLSYIVAQSQEEYPKLSERQVGIAVFDRRADFDPKLDPIVRIEARRLRDKLERFYQTAPPEIPVVIEMPKGSYRADFHFRPRTNPTSHAAGSTQTISAASPLLNIEPALTPHPSRDISRRPKKLLWISLAVLLVLLLSTTASINSREQMRDDRAVRILAFRVPATPGIPDGASLAGMVADQVHQLQSKTRIAWSHQPVDDEWSAETAATPLPGRIWRKLNELAALDDPFRAQAVIVTASLEILGDGGVVLYLRGNGMAARTFTGRKDQLEDLMKQAAEYVYSQSQPSAYSVFLNEQHRYREAAKFCSEVYPNAVHTADRSQLVFSWGSALDGEGDVENAIDKFRIALQLRPQSWGSYVMLIDLLYESGRIDESLDLGSALERNSHRGSWFFAHLPPWVFRPTRPDTYQSIDILRMNNLAVKQAWEASLAATKGTGILQERAEAYYAGTLALLHERNHAKLELEVAQNQEQSPEIELQSFLVKGWLDEDAADFAALRSAAQFHRDALLVDFKENELSENPESLCQAAVLYQRAGDPATADTFIDHASDLPECLTGRAEIADLRGDYKKADEYHRSAIQRATRLPRAHYEYALFLLERGEGGPAQTQLLLAHQSGPHWAEPLKKLGDLAMAGGDYESAVHYYQQASWNAPQWGELLICWGEALLHIGNKKEANEKFNLASGMDLTDQEQKQLKQDQFTSRVG